MEITEEDLNVPLNVLQQPLILRRAGQSQDEKEEDCEPAVLRNKITTGPIVKAVHHFRFAMNKPFKGLELSTSADDGWILTKKMQRDLRPFDPDSFGTQDDFDDLEEEMLKFTSKEELDSENDVTIMDNYEPEIENIVVFVNNSSVNIANGPQFQLPATVRASRVLKGISLGEGKYDEDSLVITLRSHLVLLIRFYYVDSIIKPYVVQWWKTSHLDDRMPKLSDVGRDVLTHDSGTVVALTAMQNVIRLYYCAQTPRGAMLDRLHNLVFDGTILHSCFLEPLKDIPVDTHAMLCSLMMTSGRRYIIRLFELWLDESKINEHTPLLLPNHFGVPIFVVPFQQSMMMVMESDIILVSMHNIMSADYSFGHAEFPGSFPVNYTRPITPILGEKAENEVLISTEDGTIYSIVIYDTNIHIRPILRVPRVNNFTLEKKENGYHLIYTSDVSDSAYIIFEDIVHDASAGQSIPVSRGDKIHSWANWAPLWDVEVVDSPGGQQELWLAHGRSVSKLKRGICATKAVIDPTLKQAHKVFLHLSEDAMYFIMAYFDRTMVYKYEDDALVDVPISGLDLLRRTIHISSFEGVCFQVTEDTIVVADIDDDSVVLSEEFDSQVVYVDCFENIVAVITEDATDGIGAQSELRLFQAEGQIRSITPSLSLEYDPTFVKLIVFQEKLLVVVGTEQTLMVYLKSEGALTPLTSFTLEIQQPHDFIALNNVIYLTSRSGEYAAYSIAGEIHSLTLTKKYQLKLCETPIDITYAGEHLLLVSKSIWKLDLNSKFAIPITFSELRERVVFSAICIGSTSYAMLRDDGFSIVHVSQDTQPVLKSIKLGAVPRKMKYIAHLGFFAVITENSLLFTSKYAKLEQRLFSKKEGATMFEGEFPLSIAEWVLPSSEKSFRNLLVGCGTKTGGLIRVLHVKSIWEGKENIAEVYELHNIKTTGAVIAIEQLEDGSILYASGSDLFTCSYDTVNKRMREPVHLHAFKSLITSIDVRENDVLVSTKNLGLTLFKYADSLLKVSDEYAAERKATNSLLLGENDIVTTDKLHCSITGFHNGHKTYKVYPDYVTKLKRCKLLPTWYQENSTSLQRFISFGISGNIELYTTLDSTQTQELQASYPKVKRQLPKTVTQKGLWELQSGPWFLDNDENVFDHDRCVNGRNSEAISELLEAVAI